MYNELNPTKKYTISYFVNPKSSNYDCSEESIIITAENYLQHLETSKHTLWTLLDIKQKKFELKIRFLKTFSVILRKFWSEILRPIEIQIQILISPKLYETFCYTNLMKQNMFFHLRYILFLRSTAFFAKLRKKINKIVNFESKKKIFEKFFNCF